MYPSIGNKEELVLNIVGVKAVDGVAPCRVKVVVAVLAVNNVPCVGVSRLVCAYNNGAFDTCKVAEILNALCVAFTLYLAVYKSTVDGLVVSRLLDEVVVECDVIVEYLELFVIGLAVSLCKYLADCGVDLLLHGCDKLGVYLPVPELAL